MRKLRAWIFNIRNKGLHLWSLDAKDVWFDDDINAPVSEEPFHVESTV